MLNIIKFVKIVLFDSYMQCLFTFCIRIGINWSFLRGVHCPLYDSDDMKWKLGLDDCKQACIDDENCKGLTYLPPGEEDNCFGKTDVCEGDEYELRDGAEAYVLVRGMFAGQTEGMLLY